MHTEYKNPGLRELRDQQVRFAPREKKIQQADRAEQLLGEIDPKKVYPYDYVCYRVTDYRPDSYPSLKVTGEEAIHDLRLFIEDLTDVVDLQAETADEPVLTVEEVSKRFNVSTKTVSRWRQMGLVSRRFVFNGRKRVGFLESSVERFVEQHGDRVKRGSRFSQLDDEERALIVERARRLARAGGCPADVTKRLARRLGRSVETIRYTLKNFDQQNPELAVFPDASGPLDEDAKGKIYQEHRRGTSVEVLAKRFCRNKTSVYRIINEMRAKRIFELPLDCIYNEEFDSAKIEDLVNAPLPEPEVAARKARRPSGLPQYLASLYEVPLLTREQEQHLFRRMNYLKYKANKLRETLDPTRAKSSVMDTIEKLYEEAVVTKNRLVRANLRLVVSIAKRHVGMQENFFELVSDGNMSLMRAVEKFDYGRGNKFSTYATWAIMKNFARSIPGEHRQRERFRTSSDELFVATEDTRGDQYAAESAQTLRESHVGKILDRLDDREQKIIISRFGLDYDREPLTLKEVGAELGVTKERIRQIEARALNKLRKAAEEEKIDLPGV